MNDLELAKEVERIILELGLSIEEGINKIKSYYLTSNKNSSYEQK